jgi:hypothetical protein
MRAVNLAHDLRSVGDTDRADVLVTDALAGLRTALGPDHPDIARVLAGTRAEGDIEPPPT